MIVTERTNRNTVACDFAHSEKKLVDTSTNVAMPFVAQTPLSHINVQYTEVSFGKNRLLLTRTEVEMLHKRLNEITLPRL